MHRSAVYHLSSKAPGQLGPPNQQNPPKPFISSAPPLVIFPPSSIFLFPFLLDPESTPFHRWLDIYSPMNGGNHCYLETVQPWPNFWFSEILTFPFPVSFFLFVRFCFFFGTLFKLGSWSFTYLVIRFFLYVLAYSYLSLIFLIYS